MDDHILKKIKAFPPLDDTVMKIQRICVDKNSSLADLVKVVESDPMLTANILKSSNSPLYGFSREIKNIAHAVSLFGMATVRGFALSSAIKQNIKINLEPYRINNALFLEISTLQSMFMFKWYSKVDKTILDVLQPASFMLEVGKIIIAHELIEQEKDQAFQTAIASLSSLDALLALEKEFVGFSNEEITAKIFEQWNLENELVESIKFCNAPETAPEHIKAYSEALHVVQTAINIFAQMSETSIQDALVLIDRYGLDKKAFLETVELLKQ